MIFTMENIKMVNLDNEFQLTVLSAKKGQLISRHEFDEQPDFDKIEYLDDYKINKSLTNYLFMEGKVKVSYEWEADEISKADVDKIEEINANNPEDSHTNKTITDNLYSYEIDMGGYVTEWKERSANYELSTNKASIESMEDDTIVICCLQNSYGFKFYNIDIQPNETIEAEKFGNINYLLFGNKCEVTVPSPDVVGEEFKYNFNPYDCKKLTSEKCFIKNVSDKICRVVMICKS
tara:strand:+ start:296 stop:1000 length:705 start_codon:yes stop_codon:yes gene_type:complete